jgi:hypothetical protein
VPTMAQIQLQRLSLKKRNQKQQQSRKNTKRCRFLITYTSE